jgi:hypothetical protein
MIDLSTAVFLILILVIALILAEFQRKDDTFDLRDIICSWDVKSQKQIVTTSKSLLAGSFIVSSYYLVKNPSDIGFGAYLATWVANGGVAAWQKVKQKEVK